MANRTLNTRLRLKYDTAANWAAKNPVLLAGEIGIESDTLLGKVGDGTKAWQQIEYLKASKVNAALTFNSSGNGAASGTTFDGSTARTISYNTIGAAASSHTHKKSEITDFPTLAAVATSGSYNDLNNKPTIPTKSSWNYDDIYVKYSAAQSLDDTQKAQARSNIGAAAGNHTHNYLEKTTYEKSAELACGSNGLVCLGKFGAYDTNITIELNSTTSQTYHATIVIWSQNVVANGTGGSVGCYVYDDADNHITPLLSVFRPYGSASRQIEVYANLPGWSKNLVHIQGVALSDGGMTDVLTSVASIPTSIDGKIKVTPINVLATSFAAIGHSHTLTPTTTSVVKEINSGSGSFTPTTKYLHPTTTSAAPNSHTHSVTVSGTTDANSGTAVTVVTSVGAFSGGSGGLTSVATKGTNDITYVESVTHTAASLTGTKTFNTDAIKEIALSASATSTAGPKYVESISGSAPSLGGTTTFVTAQGSFSGGSGNLTSNDTASGGIAYIATASYNSTSKELTLTTKYLHHTHTAATLSAASTGTVTISGGSYSATTKYMAHSTTAASTGTVGISGGSISPTTKYLHHTHTAATLGTASTSTAAPSGHTHSFSDDATTAANSGSAVNAITSLAANATKSTGDITYIESATHTHTGASVKSNETVVKSITID